VHTEQGGLGGDYCVFAASLLIAIVEDQNAHGGTDTQSKNRQTRPKPGPYNSVIGMERRL
jgi:hypothetical protein